MEKLKMHSKGLVEENIEKIAMLFPNCVSETKDTIGNTKKVIDFSLLKQELSDFIVDGMQERYQLSWPGKKDALLAANTPIAKTLRPMFETSVNFESTKNIFIEGDNLDALKLLQENYLGKVKLVYIDPPYNTGKDFVYTDNRVESKDSYLIKSNQVDEAGNQYTTNLESNGRYHSDWLSMIYARLKLARNLLTDDGVLLISIDEVEVANLRKIMEEIFGENNYVGEIVWKNSSKNDQDYISIQHEYILCAVKNKQINKGEWIEKKEGLEEIYKAFDKFREERGDDWDAIHKDALDWYKQFPEANPIYSCKHYSWMDEKGVYFPSDISGPNYGQYRYDVTHPTTGKICKEPASGWRYPEVTMKSRIADNLVHFGKDETTIPNNKTYLKDTESQSLTSIKYKDGRVASKELKKIFGENVFTNPKDPELLNLLMKALKLNENDIVLDFFAGSATTAHAVMLSQITENIPLRFILVQIPEDLTKTLSVATGSSKTTVQNAIKMLDDLNYPKVLSELSKERLRRTPKYLEDTLNINLDNFDFGFRAFKIDSSNMSDTYYSPDETQQNLLEMMTDNVKSDRTSEDLLFQVLLDWGVDLALPISKEIVSGNEVFFVDQNALAACFVRNGEISEDFCKELAKREPVRAVFRDSGFKDDSMKINVEQIFKLMSPSTQIKTI